MTASTANFSSAHSRGRTRGNICFAMLWGSYRLSTRLSSQPPEFFSFHLSEQLSGFPARAVIIWEVCAANRTSEYLLPGRVEFGRRAGCSCFVLARRQVLRTIWYTCVRVGHNLLYYICERSIGKTEVWCQSWVSRKRVFFVMAC